MGFTRRRVKDEAEWLKALRTGFTHKKDGQDWSPPRYSESIEAAMLVVEKMRSNGWSFACTLYEGKLPYASFCKRTVASSRNAEADSLPEAICRAASNENSAVICDDCFEELFPTVYAQTN